MDDSVWIGKVAPTRLDGDLARPATARLHTVIAARVFLLLSAIAVARIAECLRRVGRVY